MDWRAANAQPGCNLLAICALLASFACLLHITYIYPAHALRILLMSCTHNTYNMLNNCLYCTLHAHTLLILHTTCMPPSCGVLASCTLYMLVACDLLAGASMCALDSSHIRVCCTLHAHKTPCCTPPACGVREDASRCLSHAPLLHTPFLQTPLPAHPLLEGSSSRPAEVRSCVRGAAGARALASRCRLRAAALRLSCRQLLICVSPAHRLHSRCLRFSDRHP